MFLAYLELSEKTEECFKGYADRLEQRKIL